MEKIINSTGELTTQPDSFPQSDFSQLLEFGDEDCDRDIFTTIIGENFELAAKV